MNNADKIANEFSLAHLVTPTTKLSSELNDELIKIKQSMAVSEVRETLFEWVLKSENRPPETPDLQEQMDYVNEALEECEIIEDCARSRLSEIFGGRPQSVPIDIVNAVAKASKESLAGTFAKRYDNETLNF